MLKEGNDPLDYDQLIMSVRLNSEPLKTQADLNAAEAMQIRKDNPFLNSVKYTNYELPE